MKYNSHEREAWLKSIYPKFKKQQWHSDKVFHPTHIKNHSFFKEDTHLLGKIDPRKIHGIEYAYLYNDPLNSPNKKIDWLYMLHNLKRLHDIIDNFKTTEEIINHIHNCKESKVVLQFGDHYFTTAGQHRLCLAKFLEIPEVEVEIIRYKFDRDSFIKSKIEKPKPKAHWLSNIFHWSW
jgi:hypothetical protein